MKVVILLFVIKFLFGVCYVEMSEMFMLLVFMVVIVVVIGSCLVGVFVFVYCWSELKIVFWLWCKVGC